MIENTKTPAVALAADVPLERGIALYREVAPFVRFVKVGLSLFVEHGPASVHRFRELGAEVFLDLKLHDIPNTVALAARHAGELGVSILTLHAAGGDAMIRAAKQGAMEGAQSRGHPSPRVLAVTVLTSLSDADLQALGFRQGSRQTVESLARLSMRSGADGVVCSAQEAGMLRQMLGPEAYLCTPGIRPTHGGAEDQVRTETPGQAARAGSNLLVVGRPIYTAPNPREAASAISRQISAA